jgi:hypothetical protein
VLVERGSEVRTGDDLAIIEAMKVCARVRARARVSARMRLCWRGGCGTAAAACSGDCWQLGCVAVLHVVLRRARLPTHPAALVRRTPPACAPVCRNVVCTHARCATLSRRPAMASWRT